MVNELSVILKEKTEKCHCDILYAKWMEDRLTMGRILSQININYPHYSMHDESHSQAILNYVVRIVGLEVIREKFSATDLWLLLSTAYYHDIGMVLLNKDLSIFSDDGFIDYIKEIKNDKSHSLFCYAYNIEIEESDSSEKKRKLKWKKSEFDLEILNSIRYLIAEYYRKIHGERSCEYIKKKYVDFPEDDITSIIPRRLFKKLGDICSAHTCDFSVVMKLPQQELGLGTEYAHPRFIACLLRLGDLFDLDNNRFNFVSFKSLGNIPSDSHSHFVKHLSIDRYNLNQKEIEIHAEVRFPKTSDIIAKKEKLNKKEDRIIQNAEDCLKENRKSECAYNVAKVTRDWFDYIRKEIADQSSKWSLIVPEGYDVQLPAIKTMEVDLLGYEYLNKDEKPSFQVDSSQAFELLQGMNLYTSPWQSIRELLQNAVDTSLIRFWNDIKASEVSEDILFKVLLEKCNGDEKEEDVKCEKCKEAKDVKCEKCKEAKDVKCEKCKEAKDVKCEKCKEAKDVKCEKCKEAKDGKYKKYKETREACAIDVYISKLNSEDENESSDNKEFMITIADKGMGISKEELQYLVHVGSAGKNPIKAKKVEGMPNWMRPSGTFGIGFQSIFMITDKVIIQTKSYDEDIERTITMFDPNSDKKGDILIQENKSSYNKGPFTAISFLVGKKNFDGDDNLGIKQNKIPEEGLKGIDEFDVFSSAFGSIKIDFIVKHIALFAKYCPFKIQVFHNDKTVQEEDGVKSDFFKYHVYFNKEKCPENFKNEKAQLSLSFTNAISGYLNVYYKNQYVDSLSDPFSNPFIDVDFNILEGDASKWLSLDRNSILKERVEDLRSMILYSLTDVLEQFTKKQQQLLEIKKESDTHKEEMLSKLSLFDYIFLDNKKINPTYKVPESLKDKWKEFNIQSEINLKLSKLIDQCKALKIQISEDKGNEKSTIGFNEKEGELTIVNPDRGSSYYFYLMIVYVMKDILPILKVENSKTFVLKKKEEDSKFTLPDRKIKIEILEDILRKYIEKNKESKRRYLIPCLEKYSRLAISKNPDVAFIDSFLPFDLDASCVNLMISPFFNGKNDVTSTLISSVYENQYCAEDSGKEKVTKKEIEDMYSDFVGFIKQL
ncbi:ATP-binding protein [uncultured Bacteroides sp.]|uniref:HD domain-containing protein n=1 Tax=uncultured Bacteroides sp. TaxID=162156 RepID=UPI002AA7894F|nr:ATP-binding protein [uncultured Bacteroides sp.]